MGPTAIEDHLGAPLNSRWGRWSRPEMRKWGPSAEAYDQRLSSDLGAPVRLSPEPGGNECQRPATAGDSVAVQLEAGAAVWSAMLTGLRSPYDLACGKISGEAFMRLAPSPSPRPSATPALAQPLPAPASYPPVVGKGRGHHPRDFAGHGRKDRARRDRRLPQDGLPHHHGGDRFRRHDESLFARR